MTSIDKLKSNISSGLARSNRYKVVFHTDSEVLNVFCDSVGMPGRQIFTNERETSMKTEKIAYAFGSEDVPISFILTNDFRAWNFIYDWHSRIIGNIGGTHNFTVEYKNMYTEDIEIHHLGTDGESKKKILLKNAFPTTLSSIELGNGNDNEVIRVSTEFSYDNWTDISANERKFNNLSADSPFSF